MVAISVATLFGGLMMVRQRNPPLPPNAAVIDQDLDAGGRGVLTLVSDSLQLDRKYGSMEGPMSVLGDITLGLPAGQETVWLKGIKARAEASSGAAQPQEYFCHSSLALDVPGKPASVTDRFFTLVEGRLDLQLPLGFAIPVRSDVSFRLDTTSRHPNFQVGDGANDVRVLTEVSYLTSSTEEGVPLQPLFRRTLYIYDKKKAGARPPVPDSSAQSEEVCASPDLQLVKGNPMHWKVPPGTHVYEMEVGGTLDLAYDTTAHYVTGHLHDHSDWLRLVEVESGKVLVELTGEAFPGRRGLQKMSYVSSREGIPLRKDRRYKLVASYTNNTTEPIDAMAILYLYLLDKDAVKV